jgi:molecular chaperone HtpG
MNDMSRNGGNNMFGAMPSTYQITVNGNHPLIEKLANESDESAKEALAKHIADLALLSQNLLSGADLTAFIKRTAERL